MLFTLRTTHTPATDLGYVLHKNPRRVQRFEQSFGYAHVFYPEATDDACTCALLLDVDPVAMVRNRRGPSGEGGALDQYVNDRPYVASSFLSVAISDVFGSAMAGRSKERPELVDTPIPLTSRMAVVRAKGGEALLRSLFEPLGYSVTVAQHHKQYFTLELSATKRVADLLAHVYVLLPVLDDQKQLLGGEGRGGEATAHRRGVARVAPGARHDHTSLPGTLALTRGHRHRAADRRRGTRGGA